jgi:hypothetical protein
MFMTLCTCLFTAQKYSVGLGRKFLSPGCGPIPWLSEVLYLSPYSRSFFLPCGEAELELDVQLLALKRQTPCRQGKILRYQAIKSTWTCCFKTEIHNYSFDARKTIWNENVQRKICQGSSYLSFAVLGNVKLKLPIDRTSIRDTVTLEFWLERHDC